MSKECEYWQANEIAPNEGAITEQGLKQGELCAEGRSVSGAVSKRPEKSVS
jgi:hypothetical protein